MRWGERLRLIWCAPIVLALAAAPAAAREEASILLDYQSGAVLDARNADDAIIPASLTKMMTLYLTFGALASGQLELSSRLKVSSRAAAMPQTKRGLRRGDTIEVEDAIMGLVTRSANDAASVLAEALGGSEDRFAMAMTRTARKLGMTRTVFRNASGLPDGEQRTTARDLARLATRLIEDFPAQYRYFSSPGFTFRGRNHPNHNRLLATYPGMDGLKTGYTQASGFNLAASAVRGGRRLVAVVIGGRTASARDAAMVDLLDSGFVRGPQRPLDELEVAEREPARPGRTKTAALAATDSQLPPPKRAEVVVASLDGGSETTTSPPPPRSKKVRTQAGGKRAGKAVAHNKGKSRPAPAAPAASQAYGVQVGAFQRAAQARTAMAKAIQRAPDQLRGAFASVSTHRDRKRTLFKATLIGMSKSEATTTCRLLKKQRQACMVIQAEQIEVASR